MDLSDISPSPAEFLEKEKMFLDEHNNTDVGSISTIKHGTTSPHDLTNSSSDEEIGNLLKQMRKLLSPRDIEFLKANEGKDVDELLKETEEFIQRSSPLFRNLSVHSTSTENSVMEISSADKLDETNIEAVHSEGSVAKDSVNRAASPGTPRSVSLHSKKEVLDADDVPLSLNIEEMPFDSEQGSVKDLLSEDNLLIGESLEKAASDPLVIDGTPSDRLDNISSEVSLEYDKIVVENNNSACGDNENNNLLLEENNYVLNVVNYNDNNLLNDNNCLEMHQGDRLLLSDLNISNEALKKMLNNDDNNNDSIECNSPEVELELAKLQRALKEAEGKYTNDIEMLRNTYEQQISRLKEQINLLNSKLENYKINSQMEKNGSEDISRLKSAEKENKELKKEIDKLEHLIEGYQRENKKLFCDITTSKRFLIFVAVAAIPLLLSSALMFMRGSFH